MKQLLNPLFRKYSFLSVFDTFTLHTFIIRAASRENLFSGFPTRSATNRGVQPQKMARGLKFRIKEVEGLFFYVEKFMRWSVARSPRNLSAPLFSHMQKTGFLMTRLILVQLSLKKNVYMYHAR